MVVTTTDMKNFRRVRIVSRTACIRITPSSRIASGIGNMHDSSATLAIKVTSPLFGS